MSTLKKFIAESHVDAKLVRAVVRQIGGWESFTEKVQDVYRHGADGGFSGFIYYADTVPFAKKNRKEIVELAKNIADDFGEGVFKMIAGFRCLSGDYSEGEIAEAIYNIKSENDTQVLNALAWFALEEVCRSYVDYCIEA